MTFLQSLFIYLYPKKFQLSLWTFGQSSRKRLLLVNGQCSNVIMYVLSIRSGFVWEKICLEISGLSDFFLPVCKRAILIVLWFIWKTEWRWLNCRNKLSPNYSTICFACGFVYWKRAMSVFCMDYFINIIIISFSLLTSFMETLSGLHTPLLPSSSSPHRT